MILATLFNFFTTFGAVFLIILTCAIFISNFSQNKNLLKFKSLFIENSVILVLLVSFVAVVGSLIYSEVFKFEPCILCWWQRIFIYPIFLISLVAIIKKKKNPFIFITPLAIIGLAFSLYHNYLILSASSSNSLFCNPSLGADCLSRYVEVWGMIDIPFMSFSIAISILVISLISQKEFGSKRE